MTSQINPNDIDGNYPIAGVSNNTQGMRDNFTNTKTNFQYAADEITDLQSKVLLKAALTGTTLDNNLANNVIYNAQIRGFSGTTVAIANTSGTINIDCNAGHYQSIVMAGNISLGFDSNTWPAAGTAGMVRTQITVDQAGRTMALPLAVSNGVTGIQGFSSNVITFAQAGTYEFGFLTTTGGGNITIFDLNRPLSYYTNDVTMLGNLTVSGDIFGNVTLTDISVGTVTATGNVQAGNLRTTGLVSATGNVTGGNIRTGGAVSAGGNVLLASGAAIGIGTTTPDTEVTILGYPQTVSYSLTGNSTTSGTDLHITGADSANTRITQDSFGTGVYVAFTGRAGRGTAASPTQTQSGDTLAQFTARGYSNGSLQFGNVSTGRVDIVAAENFTDTSRATKVQIFTTPTGTITPVATATFDSTGAFSATGNVTGGNLNAAGLSLSSNVVSAINSTSAITTTANITGGNILGGANVNATTHTGTTVSVSGNITGGNINAGSGFISTTGNVTGGNVLSSAVLSAVGAATILSGTAVPAGGTAGAGYKFSSTANLGIFFGSGAPTLSAAQGSLYLNTTGNAVGNRMYVNTNGSTGWTAVTTAT